MRTIGVITSTRADYGIYRPLLHRLHYDPSVDLKIIATGMHISPRFGETWRLIVDDGFEITECVETLLASDTAVGAGKSLGLAMLSFTELFERLPLDILVVLGDRYETMAPLMAALLRQLPVAHIHGGEVTSGAIDDALRHSFTKLSHLHFAATQTYAQRIIQLGEDPERVWVTGALSLDNLRTMEWMGAEALKQKFDLHFDEPPLLVTYHPVTLEKRGLNWQVDQLLEALAQVDLPIVFTLPNADPEHETIISRIYRFAESHAKVDVVGTLGTQGYFSLMRLAAAMVGNSSSGILEAPSFKLPVVNVGTRQDGRVRATNVIDVGYEANAILKGIQKALSPQFHKELNGMQSPYVGDGPAAEIIADALKSVDLTRVVQKTFFDVKFAHLE